MCSSNCCDDGGPAQYPVPCKHKIQLGADRNCHSTATVRRIWLPGPGVSTLPYTASDLRNNRYWCWAEPQKAQFVHIASLLHPAPGRTRGHDASAPHPLCSPVLCSYRRNFCRLFVSNYIINYAKANGKNYHIYFYCVGMDICMNIKLYE